MVDPSFLILGILLLCLMAAAGIVWAILVAVSRQPGEGRDAADPDKETPPAGWGDTEDTIKCPKCGAVRPDFMLQCWTCARRDREGQQ